MQTRFTTPPADDQEAREGFTTQMTRFEIVQCGCGHEWVRPNGRANTLPCGKCGNAHLSIRQLLASPPTDVLAVTA